MDQEEVFFTCPFCFQKISMLMDCSVPQQTYVEDCEVCCRPIELTVESDGTRVCSLSAEPAD